MTPGEVERDLHRSRMFAAVAGRYGPRIARGLQRRHGRTGDAIERVYRAALGVAGDQATRAHRDVDQVTIMQCAFGCRATKRITPVGIRDFAAGKWFATTEVEVASIAGLAGLLNQLEPEPRLFVIRGRLIRDRHPGRVRRLIHPDPKTGEDPYFEPCPRRWIGLDFDAIALPAGVDPVDLDAVAALASARLPAPLRRATCWAQLTSGAGFKPGGRIRLFYWLDRKVDEPFLKRWLRGVPGLDHSLFCANEPHYVARPVLDPGVLDPAPTRSKLIAGEVDAVAVPELAEPEKAAPKMAHVPRPGMRRADRYMVACLRALAASPAGQGRATCTSIALRLYGLAKAGALDPADVTALIKRAMLERGWDADEANRGQTLADVNRQLDWAWEHAAPRGLD